MALTDDRLAFLGGDDCMSALIRAHDWASTPLGPIEDWPMSLKSAAGLVLSTRQPAALAWGPELTVLYNDDYRPFLADRHPKGLGQPFAEMWGDVWAELKPLADSALSGRATWSEDLQLSMVRDGRAEDSWWSFSYSPLRDESGAIVGLLDLCADVSDKVLARRRSEVMAELAELTGRTRDPAEVQRLAAGLLGRTLNVGRVSYGEVYPDGKRIIAALDWTMNGVETLSGEVSDFAQFGVETPDDLRAGVVVRLDDVTTDPRTAEFAESYSDLNIRSMVAVPLIRDGRLTATLTLQDQKPRSWTDHEVALTQAVAARTWDAVERARAEQALHALNETLEARVAERSAALLEAQEALRQAQKLEAMGQLTGGVAHDFNNLLTPIFGSLDLLRRRQVGGEREHRLIDGALQAAERARVLVQRLLAFARRQPLQTTAVDVSALAVEMGDLLDSIAGPKIRVLVEAAPGLPAAQADRNQLEMAILNLGVNARDAMPDGGVLRVTVTSVCPDQPRPEELAPGSYIRLSVSDTGTGMDEQTRKRAVEPFFSTKGVGKGTGLGLSMVHGLAAQLGGALQISSTLGAGTDIELWLPSNGEIVETSPSVAAVVEPGAGLALVVDDEPLVRATTVACLSEMGYGVVEADSAEAALVLLDSGVRPDVMVTDHLMPGMSGVELARRVQKLGLDCAILIVSAYARVEDLAPDLPRLTKPFRHSDLAAALSRARR